ncbi:outer membrane protein assembly factor BamD [Buchnera aphidicola (Aphis craccivora)]|uniref:Outer membrane protein assembly factor BamD n=1 Tax=Buchnera aphidicola (Aphis craccivora) TaxID=466616 RepID=A0A4D6XLZ9_9GAMM|nr:outer membrane protein assembly factor BamD [Buchnera aphidicola]QCI16639.1 outer membrane protein assembly factor BamD [Buchnera aphidicola (Aphis craccivora)]QLL40772.1 outer membrane protein assembly factor BamD [Buchnera aphidicola (Aphis craccivore)]WAI17612.1 MAG: outer membrane protein assembly factor BamD [Buchnera aphidicola (Aphis craccivora)]
MLKKNILIIFILLLIHSSACSQNTQQKKIIQEKIFYEYCKKELKENKFDSAIFHLESMKKKNISNAYSDKIQINLIYAYYKIENFHMAQKNIKEFIELYPKHPNIDYIFYIKSLIDISLDKNIFFKILTIKTYKSDPVYARKAFFELKNFLYSYPKSIYITNVKKDLFYLKQRLSKYDFEILKYYFNHKKYIAVINRGEEILQKYPETSYVIETLNYMQQSFIQLKIFDTAKKISKIISLNKF